jgi:formylglycine-generating enzyme required for sulfatase activity
MTDFNTFAVVRHAAVRSRASRLARVLGVAAAALASARPAAALVASPQTAAPMSIADAPLAKVDDREVFLSPFLSSEKPSEKPREKPRVALPEGAIEVDFLPELVDAIPANRIFSLVQFPLPDGTLRDLWLTEFKVTNDSTTIVVMEPGKTGDPVANEKHAPDARLFQGHVIGEQDSLVYLSFSSTGVAGFVNFGHQRLVVSNGPMGDGPVVISDLNALPEGAINWTQYTCGTLPGDEPSAAGDGGVAALGVCKVIELAIETDNEFRAKFSSDQAAINYAVQIMGGLNAIFKNQMNLLPVMNYLRVWSTGVADPWNAGNTLDQLNQFRIAWAGGGPAGSNPRDLAHMFSGRDLGGGRAYLNAVCNASFGFAVSANLNGFFPFPLINNNSQNWDIYVTAHEMGHNVGCSHTHDLGVDGCGSTPQNCSGASNGTIMSYCHTCAGGMSNIVLNFAAANISQMDAYLPGLGCLADACGIYEPNGFTATDGTFTDAVRLTWTGSSNAPIRYEIQRKVAGGTFVMLNGNVSPSATGYDDTTALLNTYYQYRIRAIRFDGVATDWSIPDLGFRTLNPPNCATDLSRDGVVDASDLSVLLAGWGGPDADIDGSGVTDANDLAMLLAEWGTNCSPLLWAAVLEYTPNPAVVTNAQLRSAISATGLPWRIRDRASLVEMLLVPAGTYNMGCSGSNAYGCNAGENPVHAVTLTEPFYIGRYEVTQQQWLVVMGSNPSYYRSASAEVPSNLVLSRPVEQVSWNTVQGFFSATGLRLPTEAEWEFAYRAGTTTAYHSMPGFPNGTNDDGQLANIAWTPSNSPGQTRPVGQKAANALGLFDMSGNVWEWVNDWYSGSYYASSPSTNPLGPETGSYRVLRGGSLVNGGSAARASFRNFNAPTAISNDYGFRVARTAVPRPALAFVTPSGGTTLGGTTITLSGANLTGTTSVRIGGVAATNVTVVNATTVTAVTPAGTLGAKDVVLTTALGTTTLAGGFTYVNIPTWATLLEAAPDPAVVTDASLRGAIAATGYAWRVRDNASQIEMLLVPPGSFDMGCSASNVSGCDSDESPVHTVSLTFPIYIGRYEVTQAQWTAKMGSNPSFFVSANGYPGSSDRPVESVSWNTIQAFLSATGLRLPSEAEWEFACRAGTTSAFHSMPGFPGGTNDESQVGSIAWYAANAGTQTHVVGGKAANALGLHDMSGNVWEWVNDWYSSSYYASSPSTDPSGPATGTSRALRGGSWGNDPVVLRSSHRDGNPPGSAGSKDGFRVARDAVPKPTLASVVPSGGPVAGGTTITLTGENLIGTTSVTIGGVPATNVVVVNATTATAVTPPGTAGAKDVVLTTGFGSSTVVDGFSHVTVPGWATLLEATPDPAVVTSASLRSAIRATGYAWRVRDNASQIEMLLVPPGTFNMGCSASNAYPCFSSENPVHAVTLTNAFYIGRYEVTQAQWTARMGSNPSYFQSASAEVPAAQVPNRPVELVSWNTIQGFLTATGLRLPTEAEWEYAYRAGTTTAFHSMPGFSNGTNDDTQVGNIAWEFSNSPNQTRPVGGKAANALGLHDMSGNVKEWVNDWYSSAYYASSPSTNPPGPATGTSRVLRGGSSGDVAKYLRSSVRTNFSPGSANLANGFRVARAPL